MTGNPQRQLQDDHGQTVVIRGVTNDGKVFRPSDWAQRLALAATAGTCSADRPLCFHPKVRISTANGAPAIVIERSLQETDPALFAFLMDFAGQNNLQVQDAA